jgi:hypothetical protein
MSEQITVTHERTDDIPVILAFLQQMRVAEVIDKHFPTHGHWTGLSLGQMLSVWLGVTGRPLSSAISASPCEIQKDRAIRHGKIGSPMSKWGKKHGYTPRTRGAA